MHDYINQYETEQYHKKEIGHMRIPMTDETPYYTMVTRDVIPAAPGLVTATMTYTEEGYSEDRVPLTKELIMSLPVITRPGCDFDGAPLFRVNTGRQYSWATEFLADAEEVEGMSPAKQRGRITAFPRAEYLVFEEGSAELGLHIVALFGPEDPWTAPTLLLTDDKKRMP